MAAKTAIEEIAEVRNCSSEEARQFCSAVQETLPRPPSYRAIAQAVERLGPSATEEAVIKKAFIIHTEQLEQKHHYQSGQPFMERVAQLRNCSVHESCKFCVEVQRLTSNQASFESIAQAMKKLGPEAPTRRVARKAVIIQGGGPEHRFPSRRRNRPARDPGGHRYVLINGVLQRYPGDRNKA